MNRIIWHFKRRAHNNIFILYSAHTYDTKKYVKFNAKFSANWVVFCTFSNALTRRCNNTKKIHPCSPNNANSQSIVDNEIRVDIKILLNYHMLVFNNNILYSVFNKNET